jgi:hypothetical protein
MTLLLVVLAVVLVAAALVLVQGAAVFAAAYLALRLLRKSRETAKAPAMACALLSWIAILTFAYAAIGGDFSVIKGFGMVLAVCVTAFIGSRLYLRGWTRGWPWAPRGAERFQSAPTP